jgi:hypothetical protein
MLSSDQHEGRENRNLFPFSIRLGSDDVKVTIFDSLNTEVASANREVSLTLPAGLYLIRTESGGQLKQSTVLHKGPTDLIESVPIYSAAPLAGAVTSHEYYTEPSVKFSKEITSGPVGNGPHSSRFLLFIRCSNRSGSKGENLADGLDLIDSNEKLVTAFESGTQHDQHYGWLAFSAQATPGFYRLRFTGPGAREVPIHLFENWEHQIFLTYSGRPLFEGMRHLMSPPGIGFQPRDEIAKAIDAALTSLQNRAALPTIMRNLLLHGKFENPMLGLVGAHILLRESQPDRNLIDEVLNNLCSLLPDSPDVAALEVGAAMKFQNPGPSRPIEHAPQLRLGFQAVLRDSLDHPEIVPQHGEIESFATDLLLDSPWTSWHLRGFGREDVSYTLREPSPFRRRISDLFRGSLRSLRGEGLVSDRLLRNLDWSEVYVLRAIAQAKQARRAFSAPDVARDLGLPVSVVMRIVARVEGLARGDMSRILRELPEHRASVEVAREAEAAPEAAV